jgi:VIT1/CCC1 family predicted Fe2+/Mn2+ transporter
MFLKYHALLISMKRAYEQGVGFGLTSGVITTLGLMVGLDAATSSKLAVAGGVISVAIADAMSDALGVHIFEETEHGKRKNVWESAFATFLAKFFFGLLFLVPVVLFPLRTAILISIIVGLVATIILSYRLAKVNKEDPLKVISVHLILTIIVIIITNYVGKLVALYF